MIRRYNYTKRQRIKSEHVGVSVREISGAHPIARVSVSLDAYELPNDAQVVVEAYRKASYMRVGIGSVGNLSKNHEFVMTEFSSPEGVLFRVKVIGSSDGLRHNGPLLLAIADKIHPREGDEQEADCEKLIRFVPAELEGEIWRMDFEDGPVVQFEQSYWDDRSQIVRTGWFFPLVLPTILRESLRQALDDNYRNTDDDDWRAQWLRFALSLPGNRTLPGEDESEIDTWINDKVAVFCRQLKMHERFNNATKMGDK